MSPIETLFGNLMWLSTDDSILYQHALSYKRKKRDQYLEGVPVACLIKMGYLVSTWWLASRIEGLTPINCMS
jgi:hypothetical protein